ncbi:hypothetical protein NDK47_12190 [Brevibacillus ruminantium]|uniref:Uncharacterized protein n=1 Tax=Brevibacillus ruminantium TaxID=2950604 RepID=A0ABY4WLM4_9BACL|nr:CLC_0170 family protein [Brevibacillus ruminantium]USG67987.1 hypothetical protein NDK47_12190 [Brevibacillus ruminantium]
MRVWIEVGYLYYVVFLMIVSGYLVLRTDASGYRFFGLTKEHKVATILGWTNIVLGVAVILLQLLYPVR